MKFKQHQFFCDMDRAEAVKLYKSMAVEAKYRPCKQFRKMQAYEIDWFPYTIDGREVLIKALKSYNTVVAICISDPDNEMITFVDWHGYSRSTSKQVTLWYGEIHKWVESSRTKEGILRITLEADWGL